MKRALITGGAGFIGSHVVDLLLGEGWEVTVVDNFDPFYDPQIKRQNIAPHLSHPNYRLVEVDIRDLEALRKHLSGEYDVIVHLAAKAGVRSSVLDPVSYYEVNVRGTLNLLELAKEWGVRQFVFASSSSVYGANPNLPWREDDPLLLPVSPYGATKLAGETLGRVYSHLHGIRFIALRIFTAYGPRQRPDLAIHKFARLMLEGKPVPIYGDGATRRDFTYIGDLVKGIRAAMEWTGSPFEVINLGNHRPISILEVIKALEKLLKVEAQIQYLPLQPWDVPQTWASIEKAHELLGYKPATSFEEGLAIFVDWITKEGAFASPCDRR
jgi:UDP-glucuronate 4-epimerase